MLEAHPERALMREVGLSLSKTGLLTGRQALITPSDCSRQVRRAIIAYLADAFSGVMLVVTLIRTRVMAQMLLQVSVKGRPRGARSRHKEGFAKRIHLRYTHRKEEDQSDFSSNWHLQPR